MSEHERTYFRCVRCWQLVHINFVDYEPTDEGEPDYSRPFHGDGCPDPDEKDKELT